MDSKRNERAMHTGMRAGEIRALTVDDLGNDEIYVRRSWSKYDGLKCCKNGEERSVPIPISHQLYLKPKMLADSKDICFHSWRHFFIARMLDYVQDKRYVMALSGHKTEAMLNHYGAHLEDEKKNS